jgi:hypothetical protein
MVAVVKKAAKAVVLVAVVDSVTEAVAVVPVLVDKEITEHQELAFPDKDVGVAAAVVQHKVELDRTFGQIHQDQVVTVQLG